MAKKQASHADWEVIVDDNNKIIVKESGEVLPNSMGALRTIAAAVGFTIESKWNTQQTGNKLVDFLNSSSTTPQAASRLKSQPAPAPVKSQTAIPQPETASRPTPKPTIAKVDNNSDEERLTPEDMKKIEELLKRIDALEARITNLEKSIHSTAQQQPTKGGAVGKVDEFVWNIRVMSFDEVGSPKIYIWDLEPENRNKCRGLIANGNYDDMEFVQFYRLLWLLSDGRILRSESYLGDTLREVKAFAALVGYPVPDKAKKEQLAAAIVNEKGSDGICVKGDQLLTDSGCVYKVARFDFEVDAAKLKKSPSIVIPEIPSVDGKVDQASFKLIKKFYNDIKGRPVPSKEAMLEFFDKAVEDYKLRYGK